MLDRLATLAHGERVRIKALLHGIEQVLMLPSWNPPLWPCRALGLERTILTGVGPVTPYPLAIFLACEAMQAVRLIFPVLVKRKRVRTGTPSYPR